ncbi:hypothetical protein DFH09DRAFT_1099254 [Mycena vulgaris]|nr:hypothetical protein DFH09DRAFT_1099254 [Mycena vulgaris]
MNRDLPKIWLYSKKLHALYAAQRQREIAAKVAKAFAASYLSKNVSKRPWPERFMESEWIQRPLPGPPFKFWDLDWNGEGGQWYPIQLKPHAVVPFPDLPGQLAGDVEPRSTAGGELDSSRVVGWQGACAVALSEKKAHEESLGGREEITWSSEENPTWAVALCADYHDFKVVRVVECEDYEDYEDESMSEDFEDEDKAGDTSTLPARGISDYEVRATILRVFVKNKKIAQL